MGLLYTIIAGPTLYPSISHIQPNKRWDTFLITVLVVKRWWENLITVLLVLGLIVSGYLIPLQISLAIKHELRNFGPKN